MKKSRKLHQRVVTTTLAALLMACGGGEDGDDPDTTSAATVELGPLDEPERLARATLDPASAQDSAHFIVTLNAAVVAENSRLNARTLGAGSPQPQAERAVQSVTARLVGTATGARAHRIYAHALQGFADVLDGGLRRVARQPVVVPGRLRLTLQQLEPAQPRPGAISGLFER